MKSSNVPTRPGVTLIEIVVVVAIVGILFGMALAGVQRVREAAARLKCENNVKQAALALHQHHDVRRQLPAGHRSIRNSDKLPLSGWPISLLPYLEQGACYENALSAYRAMPVPFVNPPHTGLSTVILTLVCPSDPRITVAQVSLRTKNLAAFTSYLGVTGTTFRSNDGVLFQDSRVSLLDVADGTTSTLLLGERPPSADFQFGWWYAGAGQRFTGSCDMVLSVREPNLQPIVSGSCGPGQYPFRPANGFDDPCGMFHFWSPHPGGANFAFCDGSVRFLAYSADPLMPALATRAGGEAVQVPE
jgi:prepilin-type processing-associated H-X9-DG protein/prepilin-type N-terminal cleavage/methylation domain-containing protein